MDSLDVDGISINTCSGSILFSITSTDVTTGKNTEENGTSTCIKGNPCICQGNLHDVIAGKSLCIGAKLWFKVLKLQIKFLS